VEDVIEIKLPKITHHLRKNPWIISTFVLGIFVLIFLYNSYIQGSVSNAVSANKAADKIVNFLNKNAGIQATLKDVSSENGLYKVNILYQGQTIPLYATKDGKFFTQTLTSLDSSGTSNSQNSSSQTQTASLQIPSYVPYLGSASAKLSIVEFGDYQCPFCKKFFLETEPQIIKDYVNTGKIKYYFMDFSFLGADSNTLGEGAWCANEQGKYYDYNDYIYTNQGQENTGWATADKLKTLIANINGLNVQQFSSCLDSGKYKSRVKELTKLGQSAGFGGTPAFVIIKDGATQGTSISGAYPYSAFQQALDAELK